MFQLPVDVLLLIFDRLVPRDKLECMTVCHQWHDIIQRHSLFRVIYIDKEERFNQLIEKVKQDPALGARVERIIMTYYFHDDYDATINGKIFPNLRDFTFSTSPDYDEYKKPIEPHDGHPWCETMEKLVDEGCDRSVQKLLLSGLCKNLTYISVAGIEDTPVNSFFSALTNAPALETLCLNQYSITFQDLELLHENAPLLHSLSMSNITFIALSTPQNIKPATSVKVFHCFALLFESGDVFNAPLPYITQKYTCVKDLKLEFQSLILGDDLTDEEIELWANQKAVISSHMRTLAPHLKILSLWLPRKLHSDNMSTGFDFNILDECGCRIEKLVLETAVKIHVLESISRVAQMQYIQSLTVESIVCGVDDDDDDESVNGDSTVSFDWLARFTKLKEFKLSMYNSSRLSEKCTLDLLNLFTNLKETQLESLSLSDLYLEVTGFKKPFVYPSLKKLKLKKARFEIGTDVWISQAFPNLKHLELEGCFIRGGSLVLPKIDLNYLRIVNGGLGRTLTILLMTLGNNQQRICKTRKLSGSCESGDWDVFSIPSVSSLPLSKSNDTPRITIICNSLYNFDIINY